VKQSIVEIINLPVASVATLDEPGQSDFPLDFFSAAAANRRGRVGLGVQEDDAFLDFASLLADDGEEGGFFEEGSSAAADDEEDEEEGVAALLPGMGAELQQALEGLAGIHSTDAVARLTLEEGLRVLQQLQHKHEAMLSILRPATPEPGMTSSSSRRPLHSHDDLACALLSEDCEEACNCMVDALCACQEENSDHCYCPVEPEEEAADVAVAVAAAAPVSPAAAGKTPTATATAGSASSPGVFCPPLAPLEGFHHHQQQHQNQQQKQQQYEVEAEDAEQLASLARVTADVEAQERRLEDVQAAIDKSMALLEQLKDPAHPLVLEADRGLALAHMGSALVQLSAGNRVRGHLVVPSAGAI
jgi:hypothetical protein